MPRRQRGGGRSAAAPARHGGDPVQGIQISYSKNQARLQGDTGGTRSAHPVQQDATDETTGGLFMVFFDLLILHFKFYVRLITFSDNFSCPKTPVPLGLYY